MTEIRLQNERVEALSKKVQEENAMYKKQVDILLS